MQLFLLSFLVFHTSQSNAHILLPIFAFSRPGLWTSFIFLGLIEAYAMLKLLPSIPKNKVIQASFLGYITSETLGICILFIAGHLVNWIWNLLAPALKPTSDVISNILKVIAD
ncbi:MAG: hypothetical protein BGO07_00380 [Alphaproteobacteria bacterium 40-19]|nr:MAG: hypothetical protein BGO07_00380 [Alphaproteobacteria bacterium 40-19]